MLIHQSRRTPKKHLYQKDQYESFISKVSFKGFTCLNESFPNGYTLTLNGPIPGKVKKFSHFFVVPQKVL